MSFKLKKTNALSRALIVLTLLLASVTTSHGTVKILFPPFKAAVKSSFLAIAGETEPGREVVWQHIKKAGIENQTSMSEADGIFSASVELEPGTNQLIFEGNLVEVYLLSPGEEPPRGYFYRHAHASDISACEDCHQDDRTLYDGGFPYVCLACHVVVSQNPDNPQTPEDNNHFNIVGKSCNKCHDHHYGENPKLLKDYAKQPCMECHPTKHEGEKGHPAYEEGGCNACHDPHFTGFPSNLHMNSPDICHECHDEGSKSTETTFHPPSAVQEGNFCMKCHDPHGTSSPLMASGTVGGLCKSCHPQIIEQGHADELEECVSCHDPHKQLGSSLLGSKFADEGCAECHDDTLEGETIHAAAEEGCEQCHNPHIDDNVEIARGMCFECHDMDVGGETATIHGNLPLEFTDCMMCHTPHASDQKWLTRGKLHFPLTQSKCDACHGNPAERKIPDVPPRCSTCHKTLRDLEGRGATVHEPVGEDCANCHDPHMSNNDSYLQLAMPEICFECHDGLVKEDAGAALHPAVDDGCDGCHNVHGGENDKFLTNNPPELCIDCHDDPTEENPDGVHPALDEGCTSCHDPHSGFDGAILAAAMPGICYECHDDPTEGAKSIHPALDEGCTACHDPHASGNATLLKTADNELCLECHDNPAEGGEEHPAIEEGCISCHNPHASPNSNLLIAEDTALCLECHDDPTEEQEVIHPALDEGCTGCHNGHVSKGGPLLESDVNEKCFECHDNPEDEGEVHPALDEGCTACHNPHASNNEKMFTTAVDELCLECHDDPTEGKPVTHDALDEGCTACHGGHYSKGGPLLTAAVNEVCAECHDLDEEHHYLDADAAEEHPDGNFPVSGEQLACTGCHNPHAADEGALFAGPEDDLCSSCH